MTTADDIAAYLIHLGHERGTPINNAQLQRLLYYVQARHLAEHDRPIFPDKFQAWIYGPAIPSIYAKYDRHGWQPLPPPAAVPLLCACDAAFVRAIADEYIALDEWQLEARARNEAPWRNARGGIPIEDPCTNEISEEDMRTFYRHAATVA
jgi:uncharacterized phage-associated protein